MLSFHPKGPQKNKDLGNKTIFEYVRNDSKDIMHAFSMFMLENMHKINKT